MFDRVQILCIGTYAWHGRYLALTVTVSFRHHRIPGVHMVSLVVIPNTQMYIDVLCKGTVCHTSPTHALPSREWWACRDIPATTGNVLDPSRSPKNAQENLLSRTILSCERTFPTYSICITFSRPESIDLRVI